MSVNNKTDSKIDVNNDGRFNNNGDGDNDDDHCGGNVEGLIRKLSNDNNNKSNRNNNKYDNRNKNNNNSNSKKLLPSSFQTSF